MDVKKGDNSLGFFEVDRSDLLIGFELGMSLLKKRLELVDFEDLFGRVCFRVQIGDQRKYAIRCFLRLHGLFVDRERDRVNVFPGDLLWGVFGRTPLLLISVFVFSRSVNLVFDQRLALLLLENAFDSLDDLLSLLEIVGVELWLDLLSTPRVLDGSVSLGFLHLARPFACCGSSATDIRETFCNHPPPHSSGRVLNQACDYSSATRCVSTESRLA